jgi:ligand-binding SRPBCC domain-containing protein
VGFIELDTLVVAQPEAVFDLSRNVEAHTKSMERSGEKAVGGVTTGMISLGEEVTWRARHFGLTFHMTSRITELDGPRLFVDEQVSGPFKSWWHEHCFDPHARGTRMTDRVRYETPFGLLGSLADRVFLQRYMVGLLVARNRYIKDTLESQGS